ncbi:MAG: type II toxin-antitoxin system VapC family toxin [Pseudonocardiaceae bacterium]
MAIVDASVVVEFVAPDADNTADAEATQRLFDRWAQTGEELHAPAMLPLEVLNAQLTGVRRQRWDGQAADAASGLVASLPIALHDDRRDERRAWELARRYDNYPIYDMLYVALAERLGEPLVTVDDKLHRRLAALGLILRPDEALKADPPSKRR